MFLNIITPCSRPENLHKISESINIPKENYRWIIVFDSEQIPNREMIPLNCEAYSHKNPDSISGNSQRNFALKLIKEGHVYFNDDDTALHKDLWENIRDLDYDFIFFKQENKDGSIRLHNTVRVGGIDSHNFITKNRVIDQTHFKLNLYDADGYFAVECFNNSKTKVYIDKVLSTYNILR